MKFILLMLLASIFSTGYRPDSKNSTGAIILNQMKRDSLVTEKKYMVAFLEVGSVGCRPCVKMKKGMKSVEEKYDIQVKIIFYDLRTPVGKTTAKDYKIDLIPVQVFLDENGNEYYRHKGFFPEEELVEILRKKGVTEN